MKNYALYMIGGVLALVVVVVAGGATAYIVVNMSGGGTARVAGEVSLSQENILPMKSFVTNLADTDRSRYINVTFELVVRDKAEAEKLKPNLPLIRDTIVLVLNTKKAMEVTGVSGANNLKNDIQAKVNAVLKSDAVQKVLITDIVVQ